MALALAPFLVLIAFQVDSNFREQAEERRVDLQLAAERSAVAARTRLEGASTLLQALRFEGSSPFCEERLGALLERLDGYSTLVRYTATGQVVCSAGELRRVDVTERAWFIRLRAGSDWVVSRAQRDFPALVTGLRVERPMGRFDGAMAAVIPLESLQPDTRDPALPEGSEAALVDSEGEILVATDPAAFDMEAGGKLAAWFADMRAGDGRVLETRDGDGERRAYAGSAMSGQDVYVLLAAPSPGLLSWARLNPIGSILLPLAAWLTAFGAVIVMSEHVVLRWLAYLERVAALYARGRFTVRPVHAVNAPTEIRVLAKTLDELAEAVSIRDQSLLDSLAEKDVLMREIHHRVKNNLQIISSLLSLQQRALSDDAAKMALGDTRQRISALALIYRTLYQSDDIRHADAAVFLHDLVGQLVASEAARGPAVSSRVEADSLIMDPDKLAPMALWLVEAISNALKHALASRGGTLTVRFTVDGDTSVLEVEDDGPGLSETDPVGVGRTLMTAFAKQLRGTTEVLAASPRGTRVRMTFVTPSA
ncbi:MAG: sensor histidine kinase [Alphaproteobacteria bacterium]|nr:sensor histidine kinase [Alphaproteobacteria bacterium]